MPTKAELKERRSTLARTWEALVAPGHAFQDAPPTLDKGVLDSWRRSSTSVSPEVEAAPVDDADDAIARWRTSPVAGGLRATSADVCRVAVSARRAR